MTVDDDYDAQLEGDRKTVAALAAEGDPLTKPRLVDHWIYFDTANTRDRFVDEVARLGFTITDTHGGAPPPNRFYAKVSSVTPVDLESIHGIVRTMVAAAQRNAGEYDGWESPVETVDYEASGNNRETICGSETLSDLARILAFPTSLL